MKKQIEFYETPEVEIVEINVEKGFNASNTGSGEVDPEDDF